MRPPVSAGPGCAYRFRHRAYPYRQAHDAPTRLGKPAMRPPVPELRLPVSAHPARAFYMLSSLDEGFGWLLGVPVLGYWVGQRPRSALWCGVISGWIAPPLALWLTDLPYVANRLAYPGGCGNSWYWARTEATALLFCLPAALGQLRCYLRRTTKSRLPE